MRDTGAIDLDMHMLLSSRAVTAHRRRSFWGRLWRWMTGPKD